MDKLTIIAQQQQTCGVLIKPTNRLHSLDGILCRTLTQWRRQQGYRHWDKPMASVNTQFQPVCATRYKLFFAPRPLLPLH